MSTDPIQTNNAEKSRAFLSQSREQVLAKHPELDKAYAVRDELQKVARDTRPINDTVRQQVETTIQRSIASAIAQGREPAVRASSVDAVKFQVAYQSAEHAAGERRLFANSTANITPEHRTILVNHAEKAIRTPSTGNDAAVEIHTRARETASLVGLLDMPSANNPFKADELKQAYSNQQAEVRAKQQQRDPNQQQRGPDFSR